MSRAIEVGKEAFPKAVGLSLVLILRLFPTGFSLLQMSFLARLSPCAGHYWVCSPAPPGRGQQPGPRPLPTRDCPPSFPREQRTQVCARAPARGPARRRERALCGRCRHVVVVVRRRQRRRNSQTRRSSGPGAAPRRPWLGASWVGGGGRAVAGLTMSCRPVRSPPVPPSPSAPGLRRSWRRGRPRPRRGGCHPLEEAAATRGGLWTACSGRSGRQPPREGCSGRQSPPPGGGAGSGSTAARPGSARTFGAGEAGSRAGAAFPDLAGRAHGARDVKHYSRSVRLSARGHPGGECALLPSTGSLGGHGGWRPGAGGQRPAELPARAVRARDLWEGVAADCVRASS